MIWTLLDELREYPRRLLSTSDAKRVRSRPRHYLNPC